jgi:Pathogenicity locus
MSSKQTAAKPRRASNLRSLMNVGPAIESDLHALGIRTIEQLAKQQPDALFRRLQERVGRACDPCLHDTFSAIVHEARTGEKTPWFAWTAERKRRVSAGELALALRR